MNQKEIYSWEKIQLSKFDRTILCRNGSINEITAGSDEHYNAICSIARKYAIWGAKVFTQLRSADRKFIADIVIISYPIVKIIEVACSEGEESLEKKKAYWENLGFEFEVVRA